MIPDWFQETWKTLLGVGAGIALLSNLIKDYFTVAKLRIELQKLKAELEKDARKEVMPSVSIPITIRTFETVERLSITRYVAALKAALLCSLIGGTCIGYVLQKNKVYELGREVERKQQGLRLLYTENASLSNQYLYLQLLSKSIVTNSNFSRGPSNANSQNTRQPVRPAPKPSAR